MGLTNSIKNLCASLGKNNKSTYSVVAIAVANGIFRPIITMLKKDADSESKKYAALREGLTELVAIPSYLICGELAAKCGEKLAEKAADKELQLMEQQGKVLSDKAKEIFKSSKIKDCKASLMLIGVCTAAGLIIPALCSAVMNPIMSKFNKKPKQDDTAQVPTKLDIKENAVNNMPKPVFQSNKIDINRFEYCPRSGGMKVGGV